jgi:hypothetical protein
MEQNTNTINTFVAVDHLGFNAQFDGITNSGGYHTDIHLIDNLVDPASITSVGQLYAKSTTLNGITDVGLFYRTGTNVGAGNSVTQITAPKNTKANQPGYTFLPGGVILQWGIKSFSGSGNQNVIITFTSETGLAFPNAIFTAYATLHPINGSVSSTAQISTRVLSATSFQVHYTGSGDYDSFQWFAIGN